MKGYLHSIQSLAAVDGPGLRTVVSLQGCQLQCQFCHSIDTTTDPADAQIITDDELVTRLLRSKNYWRRYGIEGLSEADSSGGVTITGGDPMTQPLFLQSVVQKLKEADVHVAVESSLYCSQDAIDMLIDDVDLWMFSLKYIDDDVHKELTGKSNKRIFENLLYLDDLLSSKDSKIRIRYVVVPGLTDFPDHTSQVIQFVSRIKNLEAFEPLPYVSFGRQKWVEIYGRYPLDQVREATAEDMKPFYNQAEAAGINVITREM